MIFHKQWYKNDIKYVRDLHNGSLWLSHQEVCDKIGFKINFLDLLGIIKSTPKRWKQFLDDDMLDDEEFVFNIEKYPKSSKNIYKELVEYKTVYPVQYVYYWEKELNVEIDELDWIKTNIDCHKWAISKTIMMLLFSIEMQRYNDQCQVV